MTTKTLKVYENRKKFYIISSLLIAVALIITLIGGLNVAIEFEGGTLITYTYAGDIDTAEISDTVQNAISEKVIVTTGEGLGDGSKTVTLKFSSKNGISTENQLTLKDAMMERFSDNQLELLNSSDVNPTNGKEFFFKCLVAVVFAAVIMIIYIGFRFKKIGGWAAGCMAVVALVHDMLMVYACFVFFRFDIDANFMAVLLTILGYSINATIIIYDRIRENKRLLGSKIPLGELVNTSVTQTLGRSINTTVTTVVAMLVVCIVCVICGVSSIISFAFPLIIGMISGVYSSNCIAPTLWVMWQEHSDKKVKTVKKKK